MKERGLFWVKPDALKVGELEDARARLEAQGLKIIHEQTIQPTREQVDEIYSLLRDHLTPYFEGYLTVEPSVVLVTEGERACDKGTQIKRQMRSDYGHDFFYTGTHASDNAQEAEREIKILNLQGEYARR